MFIVNIYDFKFVFVDGYELDKYFWYCIVLGGRRFVGEIFYGINSCLVCMFCGFFMCIR